MAHTRCSCRTRHLLLPVSAAQVTEPCCRGIVRGFSDFRGRQKLVARALRGDLGLPRLTTSIRHSPWSFHFAGNMASKHLAVLCLCLLIAGAFARSEPVEDNQDFVKADLVLPVFVQAKASILAGRTRAIAMLQAGRGDLAPFLLTLAAE
jgi:hypothetical protein